MRTALAAFVLVASAGIAFAQSQPATSRGGNANRGGNNQAPTQPPIQITVEAPKPDPGQAKREEERQDRNVSAQEDIRDFTRVLSILAFIQAAITFGALVYAARAARAALESADAQVQQLRLFYRPAFEIRDHSVERVGGSMLRLSIQIINVGTAPVRVSQILGYGRTPINPFSLSVERPDWVMSQPIKGRTLGVNQPLNYQVTSTNLTEAEMQAFENKAVPVSRQIEIECPDPLNPDATPAYFVFRGIVSCGKSNPIVITAASPNFENWPQPGLTPNEIHDQW